MMTEDASTGGRRRRRSTKISERLEAARRRNVDQLAEQRRREQEVEDALAEFVQAGEDIAEADRAANGKINALQRKIDRVQESLQTSTAASRDRQAVAALRIHHVGGRTVEQVSELLEIGSVKETRRILAAARTDHVHSDLDDTDTTPVSEDSRESAEPSVRATAGGPARSHVGSHEPTER